MKVITDGQSVVIKKNSEESIKLTKKEFDGIKKNFGKICAVLRQSNSGIKTSCSFEENLQAMSIDGVDVFIDSKITLVKTQGRFNWEEDDPAFSREIIAFSRKKFRLFRNKICDGEFIIDVGKSFLK